MPKKADTNVGEAHAEVYAQMGIAEDDPFNPNEEFDPELVPYLQLEEEDKIPAIKHPLVQDIFPQAYYCNRKLRMKKWMLAAAELAEDWEKWLYIHEKPHLLSKLYQLACEGKFTDQQITELFADIWTYIDNCWQYADVIPDFVWWFDRAHFLSLEEEGAFMRKVIAEAGGPQAVLKIYRGCQLGINEVGWSWTLDQGRAEWFARRFAQDEPVVLIGEVFAHEILFASNDRSEQEVVVDPEYVSVVEIYDANIRRAFPTEKGKNKLPKGLAEADPTI